MDAYARKRKISEGEALAVSLPKKRVKKKSVSLDADADADTDTDTDIRVNVDLLVERFGEGVSRATVDNFVRLIRDDNTIPFIARYRRSLVENMSPEKLYEMHDLYNDICAMKRRASRIRDMLRRRHSLTPDLEKSIRSAKSIDELEIIYEPYKRKNGTLAGRARELGLERAAEDILNGKPVKIVALCDPSVKELSSESRVETHLVHLLAEMIYKNYQILEIIRKLKSETALYVRSSPSDRPKSKDSSPRDIEKYNAYFDFKMRVENLKSHQILALNRGEAAKILSVKIIIPEYFFNMLERYCLNVWRGPLISKAILDAFNRFIRPWISRQVRNEMTDMAIKESVSVFAMNLKRLLMTSPIKGRNIIGIDPGFKAGCKVGIIGVSGQVLHACVLYPNFKANYGDKESKKMKTLIQNFNCEVIALGNGTACRETEEWLRNNKLNEKISLVIVPEQGASIYSCCPEASQEHQGLDPNLISAISIARRALDPLSELVKVDPKHIGVGLYQHDVPQKLLDEALNDTVITCASFVGADLNTASLALLRKIAGLTETKARNILEYRELNGPFKNRAELLKVKGVGPKVFKQCSGFLRIPDSTNKLDTTWIHPESYDLAHRIIQVMNLNISDLGKDSFIDRVKEKNTENYLNSLANKLNCHKSDVQLVIEAFSQHPHEDIIRNTKPIYSTSITNPSQLKEGTSLIGTVSNVTPFGCFVDCGVRTDGLIHNSKMNGLRMPQLGEKVMVTIIPKLTSNRMPLSLLKIL